MNAYGAGYYDGALAHRPMYLGRFGQDIYDKGYQKGQVSLIKYRYNLKLILIMMGTVITCTIFTAAYLCSFLLYTYAVFNLICTWFVCEAYRRYYKNFVLRVANRLR